MIRGEMHYIQADLARCCVGKAQAPRTVWRVDWLAEAIVDFEWLLSLAAEFQRLYPEAS